VFAQGVRLVVVDESVNLSGRDVGGLIADESAAERAKEVYILVD
jgi:hypothetical protein